MSETITTSGDVKHQAIDTFNIGDYTYSNTVHIFARPRKEPLSEIAIRVLNKQRIKPFLRSKSNDLS